MVPAARARSCSFAARSMKMLSIVASSSVAQAASWPWWASRIERLVPIASEMMRPSSSPIGTPGHSGR
jgi:hypothetical protein